LWKQWITKKNAHNSDINWISFGPKIANGIYLLATAGDDGIVKIWEFNCLSNKNNKNHNTNNINDDNNNFIDCFNDIIMDVD